MLGCLALLGLRDRTAFVAARPEFLVPVVLAFAFEPGNLVFALKLALVGSCCAALTGWLRGSPARYAWAAGGYALAFVLLFARGGALSWLAVAVALAALAYAAVASRAFELCAFLGFATVYVFGHYGAVGATTLTSTTLIVLLSGLLVVLLLSAAGAPGAPSGDAPAAARSAPVPPSTTGARVAPAATDRAAPAHSPTVAGHHRDVTSATVVGSGPNGLAAAVALARAGLDGHRARGRATTIGGGTRTSELTRARRAARRLLGGAPARRRVSVPADASTARHGSSGAGPRSTSRTRSTAAGPASAARL